MKKERDNVMKKGKKVIEKLMGITSKEENLSIIFKPLTDVEIKVTIRQTTLQEKILQLEKEKIKIEDQIKVYNIEIEKCDKYLDNINKFI